jgi:hypothetical protein
MEQGMPHPFSLSLSLRLSVGVVLLASAFSLQAQERKQGQEAPAPMQSVQVTGARSKDAAPFAELDYPPYIRDYSFLRKQLPQESRLIEIWERFHYASMSLAEQDAYTPPRDGIAIVSPSVNEKVAVRRGGYFILPQVGQAYLEEGSIQVRQAIDRRYHSMFVAFSLRLGADQRSSYADLAKASRQIDAVKGKISAYHVGLKDLKRERHDAIKACFLGAGGEIRVGDHAVADATQGHCKILALDPARIASGEAIEFSGALDIVTFVDRRDHQL